ncbi:RNA polymerase sigma factor [Phytoactinopolyspora mesophila]|uniref:Sigma-70 family RNA polymerase sigma factor n=1 Tax=Phytoactinopolyspora mesophila TaxID=2650750 RepID=A0A7K3M4J2_9ACTN|nr:SigE family RNA polymerase sigma factor [Phytoactinopolyspora mesophila]NDL58166.1 sigma-70 family RNA polymerase sigma factor [Phytoactinopolyspora mesophila]
MASEEANFEALYSATSRALLHQMYAMTGNIDDARECVQEAYVRAWQHWPKVSRADDPAAWLRTVAWRIAASRWRKSRNGLRALARNGQFEHTQPPSLDHVSLVTALRKIPEEQRRAIVLHHLVGMPAREVAEEIGAPVGTVKARLARGRAALAVLLREEFGDERGDAADTGASVPTQQSVPKRARARRPPMGSARRAVVKPAGVRSSAAA